MSIMLMDQPLSLLIRRLAVVHRTRKHSSRMRTVRSSGRRGVGGGGVLPASGEGVCFLLPRGGVLSASWGVARGDLPGKCLSLECLLGVSVQGGVCPGGVCPQGGGVCLGRVSARHTPVNRMTYRCKDITLPQLRCGR